MAKIIVSGSSDDIVQIGGDISEEYYPPNDKPGYLAFSDGTLLSIEYGKGGMWRIARLAEGDATYTKVEATDPDDDYTDRVTLEGSISWVVFGSNMDKIKPAKVKRAAL